MLNSLDLLVIVFLGMAAASLLALTLMLLIKKPMVKRIGLYATAALGLGVAAIGIRMGLSLLSLQLPVGVLVGIASIAAVVLERMSKGDEKRLGTARLVAAIALIVGFINGFIL